MSSKLRKILPMLSLTLVAALAACGGNGDSAPSAGSNTNPPSGGNGNGGGGGSNGGDGGGNTGPSSHTIGGSLTGLAGGKLTLLDNGADALTLDANGLFSFATAVPANGAYAVTLSTQPQGFQWCSVSNGSGIAAADVGNVMASCAPAQALVSTWVGNPATNASITAPFQHPQGIAMDASGNAYVSDMQNNVIRKITPDGTVSILAGQANNSQGYVNGQGSGAAFNTPLGIAVDTSGNVYVADSLNNVIRKITPDGTVSTLAGSGTNGYADGAGTVAQFNNPISVAVDASGNVYVGDNNVIRKITPTGVVSTLAGSGGWGFVDGQGDNAKFARPEGMAIDASGNIYVADSGNNAIRKVTPNGTVTTVAGNGTFGCANDQGTNAQFNFPSSVALDAAGYLYVSEVANNTIRKITPDGTVSTLAGPCDPSVQALADGIGANAKLNQPASLAVDADGNLFVADTGNNSVRKIVPVEPTN